jgi:hypothetical protein
MSNSSSVFVYFSHIAMCLMATFSNSYIKGGETLCKSMRNIVSLFKLDCTSLDSFFTDPTTSDSDWSLEGSVKLASEGVGVKSRRESSSLDMASYKSLVTSPFWELREEGATQASSINCVRVALRATQVAISLNLLSSCAFLANLSDALARLTRL